MTTIFDTEGRRWRMDRMTDAFNLEEYLRRLPPIAQSETVWVASVEELTRYTNGDMLYSGLVLNVGPVLTILSGNGNVVLLRPRELVFSGYPQLPTVEQASYQLRIFRAVMAE